MRAGFRAPKSYVGQVVNLRPIVNRPGERSSPARGNNPPTRGVCGQLSRRVTNPPQAASLPRIRQVEAPVIMVHMPSGGFLG